MLTADIIKILVAHGVPHRLEGDRLLADVLFLDTNKPELGAQTETEDATDWSRDELLGWLGY